MFYVYILYSEAAQKHYCGFTSNLQNRLTEHNNGENKSTIYGKPWNLIGYLMFDTRVEALKKEKHIKGRGIKRWLPENEQTLTR